LSKISGVQAAGILRRAVSDRILNFTQVAAIDL